MYSCEHTAWLLTELNQAQRGSPYRGWIQPPLWRWQRGCCFCFSDVGESWHAVWPENAYLSCSVRNKENNMQQEWFSCIRLVNNSLIFLLRPICKLFGVMWLTRTSMSFSLSMAFLLARPRDTYEVKIILWKHNVIYTQTSRSDQSPAPLLCNCSNLAMTIIFTQPAHSCTLLLPKLGLKQSYCWLYTFSFKLEKLIRLSTQPGSAWAWGLCTYTSASTRGRAKASEVR